MILAGDVGGTKVDLALYEFSSGRLVLQREQRYKAHLFAGLGDIVEQFLSANGVTISRRAEVFAACFGVPGPVRKGKLKLTNLPWEIDGAQLAVDLKLDRIYLINDLEANAYGISELAPDQIYTLSQGLAGSIGNRGLISAGTGLGEALLIWNGHMHLPIASEGGHADFAPRSDDEIELWRYLRTAVGGRVSYERVISGPGLTSLYTFCRDVKKMEEPAWLKERMRTEDPNAVIGEAGEAGKSELCSTALEMFLSAYGAEAGNLALRVLALGGIYVGGGIAPKLLAKMKEGAFMRAFADKGRLSELLHQTPVRIILESRAALMGAAAYAETRAAESSGHSERAASVTH
ncbi:MAG TPA: glucokinase [Acidobacteriaceae bacterium]|jgi:glucokinase|nr:glucokinase [Acidobacteriaceae bacterium]